MITALKTFYQRLAARHIFARWAVSYDQDVADYRYSAAAAVAGALQPYVKPDMAITDLGIGTGLIWTDMPPLQGMALTGLDICPDMLAQAVGRVDDAFLYQCDVGIQPWPLETGSQDMIVAGGLFDYLTHPMARHVFNEARRILKPGGMFIFTYIPGRKNAAFFWYGKSGPVFSCRYDPAWIENQSGFILIEHSDPFFGSMYANGSSYDYRLCVMRAT